VKSACCFSWGRIFSAGWNNAWIGTTHVPELREREWRPQASRRCSPHYPVEVKEKLTRWGVSDYISIFRRAIGLNTMFANPPAFGDLAEEFLRNYHRYADSLYQCYMADGGVPGLPAVPLRSLDAAVGRKGGIPLRSLRFGRILPHARIAVGRKAELIEESEDRPAPELDDARRRYYRLTALGRRVLDAECDRLQELVRAIRLKQAMVTG
jgi:hypothetical protein